ncbi:MAG: CapA family protein [Deltaproteobacteria bacterium]|nr:CapA family protein [Deltaproteobacteria bacterium]
MQKIPLHFGFCFSLLILFFPLITEGHEPPVTFVAVGDIMMGRHIGKYMKKKGDLYPFMNFITPFRKADIVFANLESVLGDKSDKEFFPKKPYNFIAPLKTADTLKMLGFNVLSMANNHAMDYGPSPVTKTRNILIKRGISPFGAGKNLDEARTPAIKTVKNIKFGFLGYSNGHSHLVYASKKRAGAVPYRLKIMLEDINSLRSKVDILVVSLHWGVEYEKFPTKKQIKVAHQLIDAGADIILGHHPHVMQGIEFYKGKLIVYSLGNFLFDQKHKDTPRSFMLVMKFKNKKLARAYVEPLDRFNSFYPKIARGKRGEEILKELRRISEPLNSNPLLLDRIGLKSAGKKK